MKLYFVLPYGLVRNSSDIERVQHDYTREIKLSELLLRQGVDVQFVVPSAIEGMTVPLGPSAAVALEEHRWQDTDAWEEVFRKNGTPACLLIKGISHRRVSTLLREARRLRITVGNIKGGPVRPADLTADFVLYETITQQEALKMPGLRLPKYVNPLIFSYDGRTRSKQFDVAVVGRLVPSKHLERLKPLVRAGLRIAIAGDGPSHERLRRRWSTTQNVVMLGSLPPADVAALLSESSTLVHVSGIEGYPRSIIEAMAVGTPVVANARLLSLADLPALAGVRFQPGQLLAAFRHVSKMRHMRPRDVYESLHGEALLVQSASQIIQLISERDSVSRRRPTSLSLRGRASVIMSRLNMGWR